MMELELDKINLEKDLEMERRDRKSEKFPLYLLEGIFF